MLMAAMFVCTLSMTTPGPAPAGPAERPPVVQPPALNLTGARILVDGQTVFGPFSVQQNRFGYLYVYIPGRGLYTIGAQAFAGARAAGEFSGRTLAFQMGGAELRIQSRTRILSSGDADAWVRHEPDLQLNVQGVLYGYGDHPSIAEEWLEIYGSAQR